MKSKCKCSLSFLDNKYYVMGFFFLLLYYYNNKSKKSEQQRTFTAQMFLFIRTIAASGRSPLKGQLLDVSEWRSCARGKSGSKPTSAVL